MSAIVSTEGIINPATSMSGSTEMVSLLDGTSGNTTNSSHTNATEDWWYTNNCNNLQNISSFIKDILEPTISCVGVVGIVITLVVLTRKYMCTSCNCYLTALAVGDLLFLLIHFFRRLVDILGDCDFVVSNEYTLFGIYSIILQDICLYMTIGVTVMLAVERYIAVCHPMRTIGLCTINRARTIIVALFVVSFILRSPKFLDIEVRYRQTSVGKVLAITWVYPYNENLYTYIVTVGMLTVLPLLALLVLNLRIIQELRRSARYLQCYVGADMRVRSVATSEEVKITLMLIGVVLAFFVCHVPYMVFNVIIAFSHYDTDTSGFAVSNDIVYFKHICHSFMALRSSCNFILYCWFSEKFWVTFKRIFCVTPPCGSRQSSLRPRNNNHNSPHSRFSSHTYFHRSSFITTRDTTC